MDRNTAYNAEKKFWLWRRGSVSIEMSIQRLTFANGSYRDILRIFSPIMDVPGTSHLLGFYRRLLEPNDEKLGIKICLVPNSPKVWPLSTAISGAWILANSRRLSWILSFGWTNWMMN